MAKDYYSVLGIGRGASQAQIQIAYETRIHELGFEPYQKPSLLEVQEAYSVLGEPARRRSYDLWPVKIPIQPRSAGSGRPPAEPLIPEEAPDDLMDVSVADSFRTAYPSFDEIHDRLWRNFQRVARPKGETIRSLTLEVPLTPQQAFTGGRARVLVPARTQCPTCGGRGGVGPYVCLRCEGSGVVVGDCPVIVAYPPGIADYAVRIPLDQFGIDNLYLIVFFRVTRDAIE